MLFVMLFKAKFKKNKCSWSMIFPVKNDELIVSFSYPLYGTLIYSDTFLLDLIKLCF